MKWLKKKEKKEKKMINITLIINNKIINNINIEFGQ
jgi:hypothetical protein